MKKVYEPYSPRGKAKKMIEQINEIIDYFGESGFRLTIRSIFYRLVGKGLIQNNFNSYKNTQTTIGRARRGGMIDWDSIVDETRHLREDSSWDNPAAIILDAAASYHVNYWQGQKYRPELWLEKDAVLGVIGGLCKRYDIPYFSCRGNPSDVAMLGAGERMISYIANKQIPYIFYLGDHDPQGLDIDRDITEKLRMFSGTDIKFQRLALTEEQIIEGDLPPNPVKKTDNKKGPVIDYINRFGVECWELDALDPNDLVKIVENAILEKVDQGLFSEMKEIERVGREDLMLVSQNWNNALYAVRY